jgi:hypothetical protein
MFEYSKFNKNIRTWNVEKVTEMTNMFSECPILDRNKPRIFVFPKKKIKKKITIFIDMHGENLKDELPLDLPLHTSLAVRPGICTFMFDKTTTETLERIEEIETNFASVVNPEQQFKRSRRCFVSSLLHPGSNLL